jgi:ABC-type uncharacterized transport system ATPase subunit
VPFIVSGRKGLCHECCSCRIDRGPVTTVLGRQQRASIVRLELRGITKRFPGVIANDRVDLVVEPGEVHGLLGENGAGKSTLMNILYGLYHADEGEIFLDDVPVTFAGPGDAIDAGIGMVHQHFQLVGNFTVAQNVVLGAEPMRSLGRYDRRRASSIVEELSARYGLPVLRGGATGRGAAAGRDP